MVDSPYFTAIPHTHLRLTRQEIQPRPLLDMARERSPTEKDPTYRFRLEMARIAPSSDDKMQQLSRKLFLLNDTIRSGESIALATRTPIQTSGRPSAEQLATEQMTAREREMYQLWKQGHPAPPDGAYETFQVHQDAQISEYCESRRAALARMYDRHLSKIKKEGVSYFIHQYRTAKPLLDAIHRVICIEKSNADLNRDSDLRATELRILTGLYEDYLAMRQLFMQNFEHMDKGFDEQMLQLRNRCSHLAAIGLANREESAVPQRSNVGNTAEAGPSSHVRGSNTAGANPAERIANQCDGGPTPLGSTSDHVSAAHVENDAAGSSEAVPSRRRKRNDSYDSVYTTASRRSGTRSQTVDLT